MMAQEERKKCFKIAKSLQRGDLLFLKKYKFPDGTQKAKYILILSNCLISKFYFYVLPTSQVNFYKNPHNNIDTVWIQPKKCKYLLDKTVIDLKFIYSERASQFGTKLYDGSLILKGRLPNEIIRDIEEAIRRARTLSPREKTILLS